MTRILLYLSVFVAVVAGLLLTHELPWSPVVISTETEHKVVIDYFGEVFAVQDEPTVGFKIPFFHSVREYDRRLQYLNAEPVEIQIAKSDKLIIDYYVVWRIRDPLAFLRSFPEGVPKAEDRLQETVNGLVGETIGNLEMSQLLERAAVLGKIAAEVDSDVSDEGIQVIAVRLSRTELPRNSETAVYDQMREQRRALARDYRVRGERTAREIRAEAERTARKTLAEANAFSEVTRGEGDAVAAKTYADAYNQDAEFYAFVRSLEAYRKTLGDGTTMVLAPDHEFFRFLEPGGAGN